MFPADTQVEFWLQWFVQDSDTAETNQWFMLPDGRRCATDGRYAVATSDQTNQIPGKLKTDAKPRRIVDMLAAPSTHTLSATRGKTVAMFGECEHMKLTTCPQCKGKKRVPHYCGCDLCDAEEESCGQCDGTGSAEEYPEDRHVSVFGRPFDPNRAAYILAHAPEEETYVIELVPFDKHYLLRISTGSWQAVQSAMDESVLREHECPEVIEDFGKSS